MALTNQYDAYRDCIAIWQRAVDTPGGIRVPLGRHADAEILRQRLNKARVLDRQLQSKLHPIGHHLHGVSEFDTHMVQISGPDANNEWWIYIRPHGKMHLLDLIEPIAETEPDVLVAYEAGRRHELGRYSPQPQERLTHAGLQILDADADTLSGDLD